QVVPLANGRNFLSEGLLRLRMDQNFIDQRLYVNRWSIRAFYLIGTDVLMYRSRHLRSGSICHCANLTLVFIEMSLVHHVVVHVEEVGALSFVVQVMPVRCARAYRASHEPIMAGFGFVRTGSARTRRQRSYSDLQLVIRPVACRAGDRQRMNSGNDDGN